MLRALLFDLDGTLAETDRLHYDTFVELLRPVGIALSQQEYADHILGRPNVQIMDRYFPGLDSEAQERLAFQKEQAYRDLVPLAGLLPLPGLATLLDWADARALPFALVTNAPRASVEVVLPALGLAGRFAEIVIGEECSAPKPDPEPYRAAMRRLGVTPAESIAFEDAPSGLRAARGSGAFVFGLRTSLDDHALRQAGAHETLADFTDPLLWSRLDAAMKEPA